MPSHDIYESFVVTKGKLVLIVDYDWTPRNYECQSELACPSIALLQLLMKLDMNSCNVVFVVTGRQKIDDLVQGHWSRIRCGTLFLFAVARSPT